MSQQGKVELLENPKYYLALTSVFRDDARFLKEWIEFYKIVGVEHFYLYNHLSKDNYLEVLSPYIKEGLVELTQLTHIPTGKMDFLKMQNRAYLNTTKTVKNDVEWLLCIDTDEFIYPLKGFSLKDKLHDYDDYATLSLHPRNFVSCNVEKVLPTELMIEELTMAQPHPFTWVKSIVKPRYVESFPNSHYPGLKRGYSQVREDFKPFKGHLHNKPIMNVIAINHYKFRDLEFFKNVKSTRIHVTDHEKQIVEEKLNENNCTNAIYNDSIFKYIPLLKEAMFKSDEVSPPPLSGELGEL